MYSGGRERQPRLPAIGKGLNCNHGATRSRFIRSHVTVYQKKDSPSGKRRILPSQEGHKSSSQTALFGCFGRRFRPLVRRTCPLSGGYFVAKRRQKYSGEYDCYICYNFGCNGSQIGSVTAFDVLFSSQNHPWNRVTFTTRASRAIGGCEAVVKRPVPRHTDPARVGPTRRARLRRDAKVKGMGNVM